MLKGRNLIAPNDFTLDELLEVLELAGDVYRNPQDYLDVCKGKLLASLFYEPSTRTKNSFDSAMLRLGGKVIGFSDPQTTSTTKGETLADSAKVVSQYADVIAVRHPKEGAAYLMSKYADCPVINAGDGGHQHPTQTLTDLLTIQQRLGRLDNLVIGVCGDLLFGRTIHSLVSCMSRFQNIRFLFISPEELKMPEYIKDDLTKKGVPFTEMHDLTTAIPQVDVLYMSRVQQERFVNEEEYLRLRDCYILDREKLSAAKEQMIVMHPLPRVNEIAVDVDADPRAAYFDQVKFGMYVRMALILKLLGLR